MTHRRRAFPLEDIAVSKADGSGRTVEAFAAVFATPAEVRDQDGHYSEEIHPRAFTKTIAEGKRGDSWRFGVFYNHGLTINGSPSDRASIPLGTPVHVEATKRGLLTVTRYNRTPLADDVLEAIRNGDITGQSFTGRFLQSDGLRRGQKLGPDRAGVLPKVVRTEIALREYGPTPLPVYADAEIVGVRALLQHLDEDTLAALLASSGIPTVGTAAEQSPPDGESLRSAIRRARIRADMRKAVRP